MILELLSNAACFAQSYPKVFRLELDQLFLTDTDTDYQNNQPIIPIIFSA